MAVGLPLVWKTMKAIQIARRKQLLEPTNDQIPAQAIREISAAVQEAGIPVNGPKAMAQTVVNVYEAVNTVPPSWPATIGLWALHVGGVFSAIVGGAVLAVIGHLWSGLGDGPEFRQRYVAIEYSSGDFHLGTDAPPAEETLIWDFEDEEEAVAAFDQLTNASKHTAGRLGKLVFTSRPYVAQEEDSEDGIEIFENHAAVAERSARQDERLSQVASAKWKRCFAFTPPTVLASFDVPEDADDIIEQLSNSPGAIGQSYPIVPWMPRLEITKDQRELRELLRTLRGDNQLPWLSEDDSETEAPQSVDEMIDKMESDYERQMRLRNKWIADQTSKATGLRRQLLEAYTAFDDDFSTWRETVRSSRDASEPLVPADPTPDLQDYLEPLLPELGFLSNQNQIHRFYAHAWAHRATADELPDAPIRGNIVSISLSDTPDSAAALGGLLAWLNRQGAQSLCLHYSQAVLPEDESENGPDAIQ